MLVSIQNVNGTSRFKHPVGFSCWLEYWMYFKGKLNEGVLYTCPNCQKSLFRDRFVGAHVIKNNSTDKKNYITPLCKGCNNGDEIFQVEENLLLPVPSNL